MSMMQRVLVTGRVHQVGYRDFTVRKARELGVTGWVRNRSDGSVEAVVSGDGDAIAAMLAACRRGPRFSAVERIEEEPCEEAAGGFEIRPTL